ncbi:hypothetical protein D9757_001467 [Collybiopsis confluens]|uniref:Uncharacterized protein n=1 Tax=Collybiopsis confluens TaxID=2823264 RepID=A0A8H5MFR4_9AGAR|nr:hypothetical protein D9757_001467 [Collybiopsis confluens]
MRPVPPELVGSSLALCIKMVVEDYLTEICNFEIRMEAVLDMDHDFVMYIYDSHRFQDYQLEDEDEQEVIKLLRQAFPKFREQGSPRWFYPADHDYHHSGNDTSSDTKVVWLPQSCIKQKFSFVFATLLETRCTGVFDCATIPAAILAVPIEYSHTPITKLRGSDSSATVAFDSR